MSAVTREITHDSDQQKRETARLLRQQAAVVASGALATDKIFADEHPARSAVLRFKHALASHVDDCGGRLVVFIDELDRCRPDYALSVLEKVRHLFNVDGVVVVIAVNPEALNHAIATLHGPAGTAGRYLRRLIDHRITLPDRDTSQTDRFVNHLCNEVGLTERLKAEEYGRTILDTLFDRAETSLRDIEQIVHRVALISASLPRGTGEPSDPAFASEQTGMTLMVLRTVDEDAYRRFTRGESGHFEAIQALRRQVPLEGTGGGEFVEGKDLTGLRMEALLLLSVHEPTQPLVDDSIWAQYDEAGRANAARYIKAHLEQLSKSVPEDSRPNIVRLASIIEMTACEPDETVVA